MYSPLFGLNPKNEVIDRNSLKIISRIPSGEMYELYLYQSETSLGFWRLGCNNRGQLYKGENDYIQQTLIHFSLQEFINKNISKIKSCLLFGEGPIFPDPAIIMIIKKPVIKKIYKLKISFFEKYANFIGVFFCIFDG